MFFVTIFAVLYFVAFVMLFNIVIYKSRWELNEESTSEKYISIKIFIMTNFEENM
jgi:hypothetical protein